MEELTLIGSMHADAGLRPGERGDHRPLALFEPLVGHEKILRHIVDAGLGAWMRIKLLDLRHPGAVRQHALTRRAQLPARENLHAWDDDLCHALDGKADRKALSLLLTVMLDGFPRGMVPNVQTYVDAAILAFGDTVRSPETLAAAILRIWRKDRYPPTIAELLEECERAHHAALNARRVVAKTVALLDNADEALLAASDPAGEN